MDKEGAHERRVRANDARQYECPNVRSRHNLNADNGPTICQRHHADARSYTSHLQTQDLVLPDVADTSVDKPCHRDLATSRPEEAQSGIIMTT